MTSRREFITLLGGAAVLSPILARAQQAKLPGIGILVVSNPEPFWTEFRAGLRERGYTEGKNITFEFRDADGRLERLRELADELVRLKVDIIVASQTPAVIAARQATTEIAIVMQAGDPVGLGLVSSLARPGGNITGLSSTDTEPKTLELIHEVLPSARRVALLANAPDPYSRVFVERYEEFGPKLGFVIQTIKIRDAKEYDAAFSAMVREHADAAVLQPSLPRNQAIDLALKHHLPLVGAGGRSSAKDGLLLSYSASQTEAYHRMAYYIDRILKGAKPVNLPVEQPTRYELVINLKIAKALGITVPDTVLARADEVIE
jgi:putative tryptophan/tyrosine transport system substrate-binding protein